MGLIYVLDSNNILNVNQCESQTGYSTLLQLVQLETAVPETSVVPALRVSFFVTCKRHMTLHGDGESYGSVLIWYSWSNVAGCPKLSVGSQFSSPYGHNLVQTFPSRERCSGRRHSEHYALQ